MRISGGRARGVSLKVDRKAVHRPATDKLRQSVFSSLRERVQDARVLDLFAGTGAYGLEALSRGAQQATFVDKHRAVASMIRGNAAIVSKSMSQKLAIEIQTADALKWRPDGKFDLIFADPPYESLEAWHTRLLALFGQALEPGGLVVLEAPGRFSPSAEGWLLRKRLGKGADQATACVLERTG